MYQGGERERGTDCPTPDSSAYRPSPPAPPPGWDDSDCDENEMRYRPTALGAAAAVLPRHLLEEVTFQDSEREGLLRTIMNALLKLR